MFHNPWVNKSVLRSSGMLNYQNISSTLVTIVFGIHFKFVIVLPIRLEIWRPVFFLFYKAKCVHLKNQAPLIFSLRTRSALCAQFVQARIFFKFFSNSFQIYFKFALKFPYFLIFFYKFVSICFKKPVALFNLFQICFKS